ncbi:MAG: hypothetical protein ACFFEU_13740 [Candidatus Thorarchaeota archaeon]
MGVDSSWKGVIKAGGLSLFVGGTIVIIFILSVFIFQVPLPLTAEAVFDDPLPPVLLFCMAAFGEFLLMPGVLALYFSLKDVDKNYVFVGTAVWLCAIPMFLVSRGQIISLVTISGAYAAGDATVKAAYMAVAHLAIEVANVYSVMALDLLGVGAIIIGLVMLKGVFSKRTAYLVMLSGALMVMGTFGVLLDFLTIGTLFGLILAGVWQILVGLKLYGLGKGG